MKIRARNLFLNFIVCNKMKNIFLFLLCCILLHACSDIEDYEKVKKYNWSITGGGYLINTIEGYTILMHRYIMNAPNNLMVDHINHNTLDNRKDNLRLCTSSQNNINRKINGYTIRDGNKYEVSIRIDGKPTYLGRFDSKEEALNIRKKYYDDDHKNFEYNEELVNDNRYF